jgi:DNA-binding phage protein
MPTHKPYHTYLIESLKDPLEAAAYLNAVFTEGDLEHILLALRNVAEARKSLMDAATNPNWQHYYQLLDRGEVPGFTIVACLLDELGLKLSVTLKEQQSA